MGENSEQFEIKTGVSSSNGQSQCWKRSLNSGEKCWAKKKETKIASVNRNQCSLFIAGMAVLEQKGWSREDPTSQKFQITPWSDPTGQQIQIQWSNRLQQKVNEYRIQVQTLRYVVKSERFASETKGKSASWEKNVTQDAKEGGLMGRYDWDPVKINQIERME